MSILQSLPLYLIHDPYLGIQSNEIAAIYELEL